MSALPARTHYHDIDAARSVLMFLSVALHAGTVYAPARPWITANADRHEFFDWVIFGLHLFITPTFFFVCGFFTVLLLARRSFGDFLWNRFLRTAVPLLSIAFTFNLIELYLRYTDQGGAESFLGWFGTAEFSEVWASGGWQLHLWFLVSLIPMFFVSALIQIALPADARVRRWAVSACERLGDLLQRGWLFALFLLLLAGANVANFAAARLVPNAYDLLLPGFQSWYKLVSEAPFFVLGIMAALSPRLLNALRSWRGWMPWAAAAAFALQPYASEHQGFVLGTAMLFANQLAMWVLVLFVLQFFHRHANDSNARTAWLADCALSMYLFHHCLIYVYGQMLVKPGWPVLLEFTILAGAAAGTVIVLHEYAVRRFAIVRLLFNGKTDIAAVRRQTGLWRAFARSRGIAETSHA